jgi:glycerate 2-kinase
MPFIKNYPHIASNDSRKVILNLVEAGLSAIQFGTVMSKDFTILGDTLHVKDKTYYLNEYERVFLVAFGKGSATVSKIIEKTLQDKLTKGFVIDVTESLFEKLEFTLGTHPLPSEANMNFSNKVVSELTALTEKDLVLVVICGGGSVMFEVPHSVNLDKLIEVNKALLSSGSDIIETNTIRKHLSKTKGGGLAKLLYPARVVSMIFSDVPGNDLSFIASGPTVPDETTISQALEVCKKYNLQNLNLSENDFVETPKETEIFSKVDNILLLSNLNALTAMKTEAEKWGLKAEIYSEKFQEDAGTAAKTLLDLTPEGSVLLVGGETTVKVTNSDGKGGRNQHLVLSGLKYLDEDTVIASIDSDGWDNTPAAGAIGDIDTVRKAKMKQIDVNEYLNSSNSFLFFDSIEDSIITDRLPSNVADLIIIYKK